MANLTSDVLDTVITLINLGKTDIEIVMYLKETNVVITEKDVVEIREKLVKEFSGRYQKGQNTILQEIMRYDWLFQQAMILATKGDDKLKSQALALALDAQKQKNELLKQVGILPHD